MTAAAAWQYFFHGLNAENLGGLDRHDASRYLIMRISKIVDARQLVSAVNCLDSSALKN
jgi:hypothetical protein